MILNEMEKKGLSPVIATVLLVAMVIIIGVIIFLWFSGMTQEATTKFGGKNIELVCEDIEFDASYNAASGVLFIRNTGNVPIYSFKIKLESEGSFETPDLRNLDSNWPRIGLKQGGTYSSKDLSSEFGDSRITIIPVLVGKSGKGESIHVCGERYGNRIV